MDFGPKAPPNPAGFNAANGRRVVSPGRGEAPLSMWDPGKNNAPPTRHRQPAIRRSKNVSYGSWCQANLYGNILNRRASPRIAAAWQQNESGLHYVLNLQGKTAVVTGASSGFGAATARALATRGARVALMARTESALDQLAGEIECASGCVRAIPVDVANTDALGAAYEEAADRLGPIEILVNNAGTNVAPRRYADTSLDQWRTVLAVNLDAAFLLTKLVMPGMRELGRGSIVNVASRAANHPSLLAGVSYSSSKLGMAALNRIANEEGNPFGIRAILVNPGVGATPILDRRPEPPPQEMRNRMLQAEDVADTIVFAVSLPYRVCLENIDVYPTDPDVR